MFHVHNKFVKLVHLVGFIIKKYCACIDSKFPQSWNPEATVSVDLKLISIWKMTLNIQNNFRLSKQILCSYIV